MSRPRPTAIDYLVIAISPALIMTLVGSLAFFLVRVFYQGHYSARLQYIVALFVFAAVLISRISIESGKGRAALFALPLALATGLAMMRFGEIRGPLAEISWILNFMLIGVIWWCTHQLTLDCTVLDESQVQTDEGLLQSIGLDGPHQGGLPHRATQQESTEERRGLRAWIRRMADNGRRRSNHGVWVVYFSMAALPLFGIGQLLSDVASRSNLLLLMCVYLMSGFGLLVSTSLISLRQYVRQKKLQMPDSMVASWITTGLLLAAGVLAAVWILPRSFSDFGWSQPPMIGSRDDLETSPYALGNDGPRDDPDARRVNEDLDGGRQPRRSANRDGGGSDPSGKRGGEDRRSDGGRRGDVEANQSDNSSDADGGSAQSDSDATSEQPDASGGNEQREDARSDQGWQSGRDQPKLLQSIAGGVWNLIRYAFYAALAAIALFFAWRYRDELRTAWRELLAELRALWNLLLGRTAEASDVDNEESRPSAPTPEPFAAFSDPFRSGAVNRMSAEELIRYTFAAVEAWAREHAAARSDEQTPTEFIRRLVDKFASLHGEAGDLCRMYCQLAYGSKTVSKQSAMTLDALWNKLAAR